MLARHLSALAMDHCPISDHGKVHAADALDVVAAAGVAVGNGRRRRRRRHCCRAEMAVSGHSVVRYRAQRRRDWAEDSWIDARMAAALLDDGVVEMDAAFDTYHISAESLALKNVPDDAVAIEIDACVHPSLPFGDAPQMAGVEKDAQDFVAAEQRPQQIQSRPILEAFLEQPSDVLKDARVSMNQNSQNELWKLYRNSSPEAWHLSRLPCLFLCFRRRIWSKATRDTSADWEIALDRHRRRQDLLRQNDVDLDDDCV